MLHQYEHARENLDDAVQEYLRTAAESRDAGENPDPPPEVVLLAYAMEALWYWVRPGDKSSEDRFRRRLHGQLDDLLAIASGRFGRESTRVESVEGLRWHLYEGGPRAGFSGYLERVGEDAPEGPERVVYWLSADGEVKRPARPGYPLGGEAPVAGAP